jgi:trans-L-3-hydroxyproline dehydratase
VVEASFRNVPSFLYLRDKEVEVPGVGNANFDVAYGGAFYAFVRAETLGLELSPAYLDKLIDYGRRIKHAVTSNFQIKHPFEEDLSFLYGTIFTGPAVHPGHHSRNALHFCRRRGGSISDGFRCQRARRASIMRKANFE